MGGSPRGSSLHVDPLVVSVERTVASRLRSAVGQRQTGRQWVEGLSPGLPFLPYTFRAVHPRCACWKGAMSGVSGTSRLSRASNMHLTYVAGRFRVSILFRLFP